MRTRHFEPGTSVTRPQEIALYAKMFDQLQREAAYGNDARRLVAEVLARL
jgi:hypothetical protein